MADFVTVEATSPVVPPEPPTDPLRTNASDRNRQVHVTLGFDQKVLGALKLEVFEAKTRDPSDIPSQPVHLVGDYQLRYNYQAIGWWGLNYSGENDSTAIRFSTAEAAEGDSRTWCENGLYLGFAPDRRVHITADLDPTNTPPLNGHSFGDIAFNKNPVAGSFVGWVFVKTVPHPKGEWKKFGSIEP